MRKGYLFKLCIVLLLLAISCGETEGEEQTHFSVTVGDVIRISRANCGSCEYRSCWTNEQQRRVVRKLGVAREHDFDQEPGTRPPYTWEFMATQTGFDTIRINICSEVDGKLGQEKDDLYYVEVK